MSAQKYTSKEYYGLQDKHGGRWLVFVLKEPLFYDHVAISRDYPQEDGAYVSERNVENIIEAFDEFSATHSKSSPEPQYIDAAKMPWIVVQKDPWPARTMAAGTMAYGGVVVVVEGTEKELHSFIDESVAKPALEKGGGTLLKPPTEPPHPSDIILPPKPPTPLPDGEKPATPTIVGPFPGTPTVYAPVEYRELAGVAKAVGARPADLLLVLYAESGLNTWAAAKNAAGHPVALGLNQITWIAAKAMGMTFEQWETISAMDFSAQLGLVKRYFDKVAGVRAYPNAVVLYQANFAPATVGKSTVLYHAGTKEYDANRWLDTTKKGYIDVNDLQVFLARRMTEKAFQRHLAALKAATGDVGDPMVPRIATGMGVGKVLLVGGIGAAVYLWTKGRDS